MSTKVTVNESPNKVVVDVNEAGEVLVNVFEGSLTVVGGIGSGTVTSVAVAGTDGIQVDSGSPITTSGTITLGVDAAVMKPVLNLSGTNSGDVTVTDTDTVDLTIAGQALSGAVRTQQSITSDASGIKLSGDSASPGNSQYYGTDGAGSKGFHALPTGTVTSVGVAGTDGIEVDSGSPVTGSGTITLGVNAATMKATLDLAGTNTGDQNLFSTIAVSGQSNVVADTTSDTLTLVAGSNVTITTDAATDTITISSTDTNTGITQLTGDVTAGPGSGSQAATIANDAVTFAKMQNISNGHLIGRHTSGSGDPEQVTVGGSLAISGANLERAALTGDVTASSGSNTTTIANNAVTYAKMQDVTAASRLLGRGDSGSGDPQEIVIGTGLAMTGTTLSATGGGGGIGGSTGGLDNAILRADGTGGSTLQNSGLTIDDNSVVLGKVDTTFGAPLAGQINLNTGIGYDDGINQYAGGNGGSVNVSGGDANVSAAGLSGGDINTSDGGGSIDTRSGYIGLGLVGSRTTIQSGATTDWTLTLPTNDGSAGQYLKTDGSGTTSWDTPAGGVTDGDKGDITVSSSGTVWTIDNSAVTLAKMADLAQDQFIGRTTASTGVPQTATITAAARTVLDDTSISAMRTTLGVGTGDAPTFQALTINDAGSGSSQSPTIHFTGDLGPSTLMASNVVGELWQLPENSGYLALTNLSDGRTNLAANVTGTLPIANGGTGQTTQTAAFDALAPTTTKGDIIVHNGTDNVRVPVGATNGHVLTVDSAEASGVKWATPAGGGGTATWTLLSTTTVSGTPALVDVALSGTHRKYLVELDNFLSSAENTLQMRFSSDGGTTYDSGATDYQWGRSQIGIYNDSRGSSAQCNLNSITGKDAGEELAGEFTIYEPHNTSRRTWYSGRVWQQEWNAVQAQGNDIIGRRNALNDTTNIRLFFATGNILSGTIRLFGWNE